ncbi:50S ribosomal protein L25 [Patescibacteria group bacterium]
MLKLNFEKREPKVDLKVLRKEGKVPAVFYGKNDESVSIFVEYSEFVKTWREAGSSSIVTLSGDGIEKDVLIQDVDIEPVSHTPRHIDFYVIEKGKAMEVSIPLEFTGVAPAVKSMGGILVKVLHELNIEVLPKDLPHNIEVDISTLENLDSLILVKDIKTPDTVKVLHDQEEVVVSISSSLPEEVEEETPVDMSSIEVEKKGKKEEEEAPTE